MSIASDYAKALYDVGKSDFPSKSDLLANLRTVLKRRGHEKFLPQIYTEYQKLALREKRLARHKKVTPEQERTRILLELYRALSRA